MVARVCLLGLLSGCSLVRPSTTGLGPGMMQVSSQGDTQRPATLVLQTRSLPRSDRPIGLVSHSCLTVHDPRAIVEGWKWYLEGPPGEPESLDEKIAQNLLWYLFLSPSLFVSPLGGSDQAQGYGIRVQPDPGLPYGELGLQSSLWLRPSHPSLEVDLTLGSWMALGTPLGERLDLSVRGSLQTPVFHRIAGHDGTISSAALVLSVRREPPIRRRSRSPGREPPTSPPPQQVDQEGDDETDSASGVQGQQARFEQSVLPGQPGLSAL
ncbi:MAG: hypothetical protein QGG40_02320 [Myxococcota bacterium]|jgi:hypothetical protein|nr:hypothetical protein [Myxococcota bacterium]